MCAARAESGGGSMTTMTAQLPLPLAPAAGVAIGLAACLVEDDDGGRVFINGQLSFAWDAGDAATRRLAAVQLVRVRAARAFEVAAGFGVDPFTLYRWGQASIGGGPAALTPGKRGPKGPSKLTDVAVAEVARRHAQGQRAVEIAAAVGISVRSVSSVDAASVAVPTPDLDADVDCAVVDSMDPVDRVGGGAGADAATAAGPGGGPVGHADPGELVLPVLPDPVDRSKERAAARWGLLPYAPPVFAPAARVPLAGLFLAVPALTATGLLDSARQVYGGVPDGFYGLDTMLVEAVCRALLGEPRAEGATRVNPTDLGRVLGLDRAPEVKTVRRKMGVLGARPGRGPGPVRHRHAHRRGRGDPHLPVGRYHGADPSGRHRSRHPPRWRC